LAGKHRELRRRIASVRTMQKTTRAMKTVSMAKLARATQAVHAARPYAERIREVLASVVAGADPEAHPLLVPREPVRRLEVVVFVSDRGLCGAYNANVIKRAEALIARRRSGLESVALVPVGRKAAEYFRRHPQGTVPRAFSGIRIVTAEVAREIASFLAERFVAGEVDETVLVYSEFVSALTQRPNEVPLLPVRAAEAKAATPLRYEIEPSPEGLLATLVPRAVEFAVFRALLENQAGEHGARMTAMDSATNNTSELIRRYTLEYNKARQSAITAELVEIVSAAEAT
jgi:F-type H+-transporting ATPase subunit gamma